MGGIGSDGHGHHPERAAGRRTRPGYPPVHPHPVRAVVKDHGCPTPWKIGWEQRGGAEVAARVVPGTTPVRCRCGLWHIRRHPTHPAGRGQKGVVTRPPRRQNAS